MRTWSLGIALVFVAASVQAGPWNVSGLQTGSKIRLFDSPGQGTTSGGVFIVKKDGSKDEWFRTLCVEAREYIAYNTPYEVVLNTKAMWGSVGPAGDPISKGTAALFLQFWNTPNHLITDAIANSYQRAIWLLEGEPSGSIDSTAHGWLSALLGPPGTNYANWRADYDPSTSLVRVLNLYVPGRAGDPKYRKQDQLVVIPEPATIALLGLSLLGAGFVSRRRRSA